MLEQQIISAREKAKAWIYCSFSLRINYASFLFADELPMFYSPQTTNQSSPDICSSPRTSGVGASSPRGVELLKQLLMADRHRSLAMGVQSDFLTPAGLQLGNSIGKYPDRMTGKVSRDCRAGSRSSSPRRDGELKSHYLWGPGGRQIPNSAPDKVSWPKPCQQA